MIFPIALIAPPEPGDVVTLRTGRYIVSRRNTLYPVNELARVAPIWSGRPCFFRHVGDTGYVETRLLNDKYKVGYVDDTWFNETSATMGGMLVVTSEYWKDELGRAVIAGRLGDYAFSVSHQVHYRSIEANGKKVELVEQIARLLSVDLVDAADGWLPQCGGKFIGANYAAI